MVRWIILAVLVVGLTGIATVVMQGTSSESNILNGPAFPVGDSKSGPRPRAVVDKEMTFEFGSRPIHTKFERDWTIRNEGDADLVLTLEAPPCSCTVVGFMDKDRHVSGSRTIPPTKDTKVHFTWETLVNGHYHKPATLLTNDPERPRLTFVAEGEVNPAVMIYPPPENQTLVFANLSSDKPNQGMTFGVYSLDKPDLKVLSITTSRPEFISAEQKPLSEQARKEIKTDQGVEVRLNVNTDRGPGRFFEELVLKTDHPSEPEIRLSLTGTINGPISLVPSSLRLAGLTTEKGGQLDLRILVQNNRKTAFEVKRKPEKFSVEVLPGEGAKEGQYRLVVKIPPGMPVGTVNEELVLTTDHPHAKEVKVPIHGFIRDAG